MKTIEFYSTKGPYGCFSNFSRHPVTISGKVWPTTEHFFQARKFIGTSHEEAVRLAKSPMDAARMGRDRKRPLRKDWEDVKENVMYMALQAKFEQHKDFRDALMGTGDAIIVEHTTNDSYWGDGGDGTGSNRLGHLLMRLRNEKAGSSTQ
jgi:N-glycosidase YbiA